MIRKRWNRRAAAAQLGTVMGTVVAIAGVLSMVTGILVPELEQACIPLGMIAIFAGTVLAGRSKSAARRR